MMHTEYKEIEESRLKFLTFRINSISCISYLKGII